jgi:hypothetical protein
MPYTLPHPEAKPPVLQPSRIPTSLHRFIPLAEKYGVHDDCYRDGVVYALDPAELAELERFLTDSDDSLDSWLCGEESRSSSPSPEYLTFTCLLVAAQLARVVRKKKAQQGGST